MVLTLGVVLVTTWRGRGWRPWALMLAIPMLCTVALAATTGRMVADFALSAEHTMTTYSPAADAWQVRDEFDQLIAALWGPRQFRPLTSRPIAHSVT